jgi:UTP--glucose-1-phosphate uridylyltransferase
VTDVTPTAPTGPGAPWRRPGLEAYACDAAAFDGLRAALTQGVFGPEHGRLAAPPGPLVRPPVELAALDPAARARLTAAGEAALAAGRIGAVILNGGMATRFGGGAKGVVPVVRDVPSASFLAVKLADLARRGHAAGRPIPLALMQSFATADATAAHLAAIGWAGLAEADVRCFDQSLLPRVLPDGTPLLALPEAGAVDDERLYCAPGHGDVLERVRQSGVLAWLRGRGVEHVLLSNVDNLGATPDPLLVGLHLAHAEAGLGVTVEVVARAPGDAGGGVGAIPRAAAIAGGGPDRAAPAVGAAVDVIVEGFRLPPGTDLGAMPYFNTNTLWLSCDVLARTVPLTWFAVRKAIAWPTTHGRGPTLDVIQFERLVGQVTESERTGYVVVPRPARFLPIKTRDELEAHAEPLAEMARAAGLLPALPPA